MAFSISNIKSEVQKISDWLSKEFSSIRTGQASPAILDNIKVDSYGSLVPIKQVGSVSVEDAKTLRITTWDSSQIKAVEKAIIDAGMGVGVAVDDKGLRVIFPELTSERRQMLIKLAKEKLEQARVSLRQVRGEEIAKSASVKKGGTLSEDDARKAEQEIQKIVDEGNKQFEVLFKKKESEIGA